MSPFHGIQVPDLPGGRAAISHSVVHGEMGISGVQKERIESIITRYFELHSEVKGTSRPESSSADCRNFDDASAGCIVSVKMKLWLMKVTK